jgi:hypothetical protein
LQSELTRYFEAFALLAESTRIPLLLSPPLNYHPGRYFYHYYRE